MATVHDNTRPDLDRLPQLEHVLRQGLYRGGAGPQGDLARQLLPAESAAHRADLRPGPAPVQALAKYVLKVRQPIEVGTGVVLNGGHETPSLCLQPGRERAAPTDWNAVP